eukprot:5246367-Alexandrium_andersonii.AAC.1
MESPEIGGDPNGVTAEQVAGGIGAPNGACGRHLRGERRGQLLSRVGALIERRAAEHLDGA